MDPQEQEGFSVSAAVEVVLGIGKSIDGMTGQIGGLLRYLRKAAPILDSRGADAVQPDNTDPLLLDIGVPVQGTWWDVRKVVIGGNDIAAFSDDAWSVNAPDGFAGLYVSGALPESALLNPGNMNNLGDWAASFPAVAYYPKESLQVRPQEHLYVVIYGGAVGQQYIANANISIYHDAYPED